MDLKSHYWPVFVISLKDAVTRRGSIMRQCQRYGIEPIITDAIDGRHGLPQELEYLIDRPTALRRIGRRTTDAEFACALSHHFIYRRILEAGLPGAVVLEDDAILTEAFGTFYAKKGYLAADFVQMDHANARVYRWGGQTKAGVALMRLYANGFLSTGYTVSSMMAQYLVEHATPIAGHADWPCDLTPLGPLVTFPSIIKHPPIDPSTSSLEGERSQLEEERLQRKQAAKDTRDMFKRWKRFVNGAYWKRFWFKRIWNRWWFKRILTKMIS